MEMLAETDAIENTDWRTYNLRLEPSRNYSTFLLEVFYKTPVFVEYNGNVLLDNASNLIPVPCDEAPLPAIEDPNDNTVATIDPIPNSSAEKPKDNDDKKTQPKETPKPKEKPIIEEKVEPTKKEHVKELNEEVVIGQEITLKNLYFDADSSVIKKRFFSVLDDVYSFLIENKNVVVEIGGHTNNRCEDAFCNMLSEKRAKAVADYLVAKGIDPKRVEHKGYGKTKPRYPNNTPTNRRRNQRVELKILSK
ncbi:MAG TPA: hypothetical protein ENJ45_05350 [Phaeodactylibacter sp.]|nr:hypothetical protein [Phaeodactylibacter sp.]